MARADNSSKRPKRTGVLVWSAALLSATACDVFEARSDEFVCTSMADCTGGRECQMGFCVVAGAGIDASQSDGAMPDAAPAFDSEPVARFQLSPPAGVPTTVFMADASSTTDLEDSIDTITFSWDWENDGTFDSTGVTATHSYGTPGTYEIALRAEDPGGLRGYKTFQVIVAADADLVMVTTGADESDANATPASPGGAGLSLREAIDFTNDTAGRQLIVVPSGTVTMIGAQLPALDDDAGVDLVGDGSIIDGTSATGSACLVTGGANNVVLGLGLQNCKGDAFRDANGSADTLISRCVFRENPSGVRANGLRLIVGPDNEFSDHTGHAVDLAGDTTVVGNSIHDSGGAGVFVASSAANSVIISNQIHGNDIGVELNTSLTGALVQHNTIDGNRIGVSLAPSNVTAIDLRNNIITHSTASGLVATDINFVERDHNDFFGNGTAECTGCSGLGANSSILNPQFVDRDSEDFRLRPTSPIIDGALDLGGDQNGAAAGNFNGAAPDIGALEAP